MPKSRGLPNEQKVREGKVLSEFFLKKKRVERTLTQELIISEMGLLSQGLFGQWTSGRTQIPDRRLIWLGRRLGFDAAKLRPSLIDDYIGAAPVSDGEPSISTLELPPRRAAEINDIFKMLNALPEKKFQKMKKLIYTLVET